MCLDRSDYHNEDYEEVARLRRTSEEAQGRAEAALANGTLADGVAASNGTAVREAYQAQARPSPLSCSTPPPSTSLRVAPSTAAPLPWPSAAWLERPCSNAISLLLCLQHISFLPSLSWRASCAACAQKVDTVW